MNIRKLSMLLIVLLVVFHAFLVSGQEVAREETLIIGSDLTSNVAADDIFNPYLPAVQRSLGMAQLMEEMLFYTNYETNELMPWLATGYESSDDFTEYTIHLRDGVKWSDGEAFTADDFVFTINMLKANPTLRGAAGIDRAIASVEAPDDLTVKLTLNDPNPRYIQQSWSVRISSSPPIVPEHIWADKDPSSFPNFDLEKGWPVFTGPYVLTSSSQQQRIYDRRDDYWGVETGFTDLPAPRRVIVATAGVDEVVGARIQNNEVDSLAALSANTLVTVQSRNPNVIGWTDDSPFGYTDPCPFYLEFNTTREPWDDAEMRAALSYIIDRDVVANIAFEGQGMAAQFLFPAYTGLMDFLDSMSDEFADSAYRYDPEASAAIMESKGYTMQDGVWRDGEGNSIVIDFLMLGFNIGPTWGRSIQILSQQFEDGGFEVDVSDLDFGPYWERANQGMWGVRMAWSCGSITDPHTTLSNFHSDHVMPIGEAASRNFGRWDNAEYSALVDQLGQMAPSDEGYFDLAREAMAMFLADVPAIGLQQQLRVNPFNTTYWVGWPTAENNYVNPQSWWSTAAIIIHTIEPAG